VKNRNNRQARSRRKTAGGFDEQKELATDKQRTWDMGTWEMPDSGAPKKVERPMRWCS
jgi:hypothetical protein